MMEWEWIAYQYGKQDTLKVSTPGDDMNESVTKATEYFNALGFPWDCIMLHKDYVKKQLNKDLTRTVALPVH